MDKCDDPHAGKCQDCPLLCQQCANEYWPWYCSEKMTRWTDREADVVEQKCHLDPSMFPLLRAMLRGEWKCKKCRNWDSRYKECHLDHELYQYPCGRWKPQDKPCPDIPDIKKVNLSLGTIY